MKRMLIIWILGGTIGAAIAQPSQNATDAISKQIGWLVIQNANLQAQVDDLKKQVDECKK